MDDVTRTARRTRACKSLVETGVLTHGVAVRFGDRLDVYLLCRFQISQEFYFFPWCGGDARLIRVVRYDEGQDAFVPNFKVVHVPSKGFLHRQQAYRDESPTILESSVYHHMIGDKPSKWDRQYPALEFYRRLETYVQDRLSPNDQYKTRCGTYWRVHAVNILRNEFLKRLVLQKERIEGTTYGEHPESLHSPFSEYSDTPTKRKRRLSNIVSIDGHTRKMRVLGTRFTTGTVVIPVDFHARRRGDDLTL